MPRTRAFISFDYDNDVALYNFVLGQAKLPDSPFEIENHSIKVATPDWQVDARARIRRSDVVIVICGTHTNKASGVAHEVRIAQEENVPYFLLAGYKGGGCVKPTAAKTTDELYQWTWQNLKLLIGGNR